MDCKDRLNNLILQIFFVLPLLAHLAADIVVRLAGTEAGGDGHFLYGGLRILHPDFGGVSQPAVVDIGKETAQPFSERCNTPEVIEDFR